MMNRRGVLAGMTGLAGAAALPGAARGLTESSASLETLVGRTLILGFIGDNPEADDAARLEAHLEAGRIGGVLFLRHNSRTREGVEGLAERFRAANPNAWLAIDQEGGFVQRLTQDMGYTDIPTAAQLAEMGPVRAASVFESAAEELIGSGFNMNLAPVADLYQDGNEIIARWDRAFGSDPAIVAEWCGLFIEIMERQGIACALKHFPGHGRSSGDSHDGFVDLTESWSFEEVAPFAQLIDSDHAHLVMGGHLINRRIDPSGAPVTLSRPALHGLLRETMRFDGAVITDDLDMGAIRNHYSREEAITGALAAGNDLLLLSNSANPDPDLPMRAVDWVDAALDEGRVSLDRLREANARIDQLRARLG